MQYQIIPDVLTDSVDDLVARIHMASSFATRIHVDVIDGEFANNTTLMPEDLQGVDWQTLAVDVQLMTENPTEYVEHLRFANRVFGHVEKMGDRREFLRACAQEKIVPGWGVNIETDLQSLEDSLFEVQVILLMSVKVGFSGQHFLPEVVEKILWLREKGYEGDIVMDGGMNLETISVALDAGANQFAVNSGLWQTKEVADRYSQLVRLLPNDTTT